jgi:predicted AlkP superfamily pyrophosphatase or phosphodiesterase
MRRAPTHVFVLIDALGWRLVEEHRFLADVLPYRTPLRTVLGYSSAAIPTILTGRPPAEHGHWNLFYYDPDGSPFRWLRALHLLPDRATNHRVGRKLVKEMGRRLLGLGPLFECCVSPRLLPRFNWVEKRNIYEPGGIMGARSIFDDLADAGVASRVYSYHRWSDPEIFREAKRDLEAGEASFFFLYLSELDAFLHTRCEDSTEVARRLAWYASQLQKVFACAVGLNLDARLAIFSDHGMTPVRHRYDLVTAVKRLGFTMPADYVAVYDSTMARFWFFNERSRRHIVGSLRDLPCGRIVPDAELEELGVRFLDRRYGEVIFLLHPGWLISEGDFNGRGWSPAGMHGYHPADPYSDAVYLGSEQPSIPVRAIADVFRLMSKAVEASTSTALVSR